MTASRARLNEVRLEAATCRNCELWQCGTQTVFGEGDPSADVMLVGEQPGDRENREGRPFVGPAGRILDQALEDAGIDRRHTYVTNAVKHFRWEPRGKRRIHKRPSVMHIKACRPWLDQEIAITRPKVIVCLGVTAAQALLGSDFKLTTHRGEVFRPDGLPAVTATIHPSAVLRAPDEQARRVEMKGLVRDLRTAVKAIEPSVRAAAR